MTIGRKIFFGYALVLAFSVIIAGIGLYIITVANQAYSRFIDEDQELLSTFDELKLGVGKVNETFRGALLYGQASMYERHDEGSAESLRAFAKAEKLLANNPEDLRALQEFGDVVKAWHKKQLPILEMRKAGNTAEAIMASETEVLPLRDVIVEKLPVLTEHAQERLHLAREDLSKQISQFSTAMIVLSSVAIITGLLLSIALTSNIKKQLREIIAQISTSTSEISAMATQVAASAAETATSVSETTTTVEEVKQTAQMSTQKARSVSDIAKRSAAIAEAGRDAVEDANDGMALVREQVASIAVSVVKLSEQSQSIGEIIATVNDLAEQSNLLSVNAAIEAARAGENGRGFAVVAQEVKSLADQSRQATAQVRTILGDIQRAMGSAVMATEQGTKAVAAGEKQAAEAGEAIRQLSDSIAEAAEAATQIAASSQQQLVGMDQIALAMENINQASAQNMAGTKQSEVAARNLNTLAGQMRDMIEGAGAGTIGRH